MLHNLFNSYYFILLIDLHPSGYITQRSARQFDATCYNGGNPQERSGSSSRAHFVGDPCPRDWLRRKLWLQAQDSTAPSAFNVAF